jgi:hypothetical protein
MDGGILTQRNVGAALALEIAAASLAVGPAPAERRSRS